MEFTEIGVIVKPHGLKGAVVVKAEAAYVSQYRGFEQLYLSQFNSKVPYAILDVAVLSTSTFKITMRGVDTVQQADALRGGRDISREQAPYVQRRGGLSGYGSVFQGWNADR